MTTAEKIVLSVIFILVLSVPAQMPPYPPGFVPPTTAPKHVSRAAATFAGTPMIRLVTAVQKPNLYSLVRMDSSVSTNRNIPDPFPRFGLVFKTNVPLCTVYSRTLLTGPWTCSRRLTNVEAGKVVAIGCPYSQPPPQMFFIVSVP